jgi:hypothetical protein
MEQLSAIYGNSRIAADCIGISDTKLNGLQMASAREGMRRHNEEPPTQSLLFSGEHPAHDAWNLTNTPSTSAQKTHQPSIGTE